MSKLQELTKCAMCQETFTSRPVVLSCCNATVCQHHIDVIMSSVQTIEEHNVFTCPLCKCSYEIENRKQPFPINKTIEQLLALEICKEINLGEIYKKTDDDVENLETSFKEISDFVKDPRHFIHEHFASLKRSVDTRRVKLKVKIDELCNEMITKLSIYERECYENIQGARLEEKTRNTFREVQANLDEWTKSGKRVLLVSDDSRRKEIQLKAKELDTKLFHRLEELEDVILMKEDKVWAFLENDKVLEEFEKELVVFERYYYYY